ncbi:hypothetical protein SNEBB_007383, partial [Seison nebaliae]
NLVLGNYYGSISFGVNGNFMEKIKNKVMPVEELKDIHRAFAPNRPNSTTRRNLRLKLYGLLYPNGPDEHWEGYVRALSMHGTQPYYDMFWGDYGRLINEVSGKEITFLNYTRDINCDHPGYCGSKARERVRQALHHQFIAIQYIDYEHLYILFVDLKNEYIYFIDSVPGVSNFNAELTHYIYNAILEAARGYSFHGEYVQKFRRATMYDFESWDRIHMTNVQQSRGAGCGFFLLLNSKYISYKIIPKFKDKDADMLRFMLLYEIFRLKLFPILEEEKKQSSLLWYLTNKSMELVLKNLM